MQNVGRRFSTDIYRKPTHSITYRFFFTKSFKSKAQVLFERCIPELTTIFRMRKNILRKFAVFLTPLTSMAFLAIKVAFFSRQIQIFYNEVLSGIKVLHPYPMYKKFWNLIKRRLAKVDIGVAIKPNLIFIFKFLEAERPD